MSTAIVQCPSKVPCVECSAPASPISRRCKEHSRTCRKCGALATEENPVESESETCSACQHEEGMQYCPCDHPYREIKIERVFPTEYQQ